MKKQEFRRYLLIKNKLKKQIKKMRKGEYNLCWKKETLKIENSDKFDRHTVYFNLEVQLLGLVQRIHILKITYISKIMF